MDDDISLNLKYAFQWRMHFLMGKASLPFELSIWALQNRQKLLTKPLPWRSKSQCQYTIYGNVSCILLCSCSYEKLIHSLCTVIQFYNKWDFISIFLHLCSGWVCFNFFFTWFQISFIFIFSFLIPDLKLKLKKVKM